MSNQVYSNKFNKYYSSKVIDTVYINIDKIFVPAQDDPLIWTSVNNISGLIDLDGDDGDIRVTEEGLYQFTLRLELSTLDPNDSTFIRSSFNLKNAQFPLGREIVSTSLFKPNATITSNNASYCSLSTIVYLQLGDSIALNIANFGSINAYIKGDVSFTTTFMNVQKIE